MIGSMDLNEILVFVRVVQAGSFNKAAASLGMPNSTVSAKVSALEERLGVTLLRRTTRKLSLTDVGESFYRASSSHVEGLTSAESEAALSQHEPAGRLRVTAPVLLASSLLPDAIAEFARKYPKVGFELIATDETMDLVANGVDLAVRAGPLRDSSLKARRLGASFFALYASPAYLKSRPRPSHPKDLLEHDCIQFTPLGKDRWDFVNKAKNKVGVAMNGKLLLNELNSVKELAVAGAGVALLPTFVCDRAVGDKDLVRVLPEWRSESRDISFVFPADRYVPPKLAAFIEIAGDRVKRRLGDSWS